MNVSMQYIFFLQYFEEGLHVFYHLNLVEFFYDLLLQSLVEQCPADDPDTDINNACLLYKVCVIICFIRFRDF